MTLEELKSAPATGWFPGHMLKAGRKMQEALKLVDLLVELVDARAPLASRNYELLQKLEGKPSLILANKADLASVQESENWKKYFAARNERIFFLNSQRIAGVRDLVQVWRDIAFEETSKSGRRKFLSRPVRLMILGVPNIGKSTLVNSLVEKKKAQTGPKPGVTRQNQWLTLQGGVELLDTPGVLWPQIKNKYQELLLALLGNIRDEIVCPIMCAEFLILKLQELQAFNLLEKIVPENKISERAEDILNLFAQQRNYLQKGGTVDVERAAIALLKDFRAAKLGRITLERAP